MAVKSVTNSREVQMPEIEINTTKHHYVQIDNNDDDEQDHLIISSDYSRRKPTAYIQGSNKKERQQELECCVRLNRAARHNEWQIAQRIMSEHPRICNAAITAQEETVLHIAAGAKKSGFVKRVVRLLDPKDLMLQDVKGNTAFCHAAAAGDLESVKVMMTKNKCLPFVRGGQRMTPLYMASSFGRGEMASFLYSLTEHVLQEGERKGIFFNCIHYGLFDLALKMLEDHISLAMARDVNEETALHILARMPHAFCHRTKSFWNKSSSSHDKSTNLTMDTQALRLVRGIWREVILHNYGDQNVLRKTIDTPSKLLFDAAQCGNSEFLFEILRSCPDLVWEANEDNQTIFHVACLNRHQRIFNHIHEIGLIKDVVTTFEDNGGNNILHLAATSPSSHKLNQKLGGKILFLRQELLWFEAVKKIVQPTYMYKKNTEGLTPSDLFTKTHENMFKDGERWVKSTAKSCMFVSTLIAVAAFFVTFSISEAVLNGKSTTHNNNIFTSEAAAVFSSLLSLLTFLSILSTSTFADMDFLISIPFKLIVGLAMLFVSLTFMMVTTWEKLFVS
ncbi:uncharacterized protein LOC133825831 [Humulus lupulus]|uniref:uncharacterized protein LOC133825831 n=1 Tax=Humulus lupulus TaxID=3486 RepID=UPI002B40975D|nr:uncharacterized protein LOC133825831 [Humulus lupulus]